MEPLLVIGKHQSDNPLASAPSRVLHGLLALVFGAGLTVVAYVLVVLGIVLFAFVYSQAVAPLNITFLDPRDYSWLVVLLLVPSVWLAYRFIARRAKNRADRCEFWPKTLRFIPRARVFKTEKPLEVALMAVGNIEFERPDRILIDFGIDNSANAERIVVRVGAPTAEDDLEQVELHFENHVPDSLYSITDAGASSYSRAWRFDELFPSRDRVQRASLELAPTAEGRHRLVTDVFETMVEAMPRAMELDAAGRRLRVEDTLIRDWRGFVLGSIDRTAFRVTLQLGSKETVEVQNDDGSVLIDGRVVGHVTTKWANLELRLDQPIPAALAAMILIVRRRDEL